MGRSPATPEERRGYLFACGLAMLAAVLGVGAPSSSSEPLPGGRTTAILVAIAAAGIFAILVVRLQGAGAEGPAADRLRKMTAIWLLLALVLGVLIVRGSVSIPCSSGPGDLTSTQWFSASAGAVIAVTALVRGVLLFRRRG